MGKGEKGRHGGFGGRSHGIGHSSFGHSRSHGIGHSSFGHGIGHSSFGHHHHGIGHSSFGHRSYRSGGGNNDGLTTWITDPNWENKEPAPNGKWKGELCDFCYSPGDCVCACYFSNCYSAMLANDIGLNFFFLIFT